MLYRYCTETNIFQVAPKTLEELRRIFFIPRSQEVLVKRQDQNRVPLFLLMGAEEF